MSDWKGLIVKRLEAAPERPRFVHRINDSGYCSFCGKPNTGRNPIDHETCDKIPLSLAIGEILDYIDDRILEALRDV